nr:ORF57 [Bracoviriform inaniti]
MINSNIFYKIQISVSPIRYSLPKKTLNLNFEISHFHSTGFHDCECTKGLIKSQSMSILVVHRLPTHGIDGLIETM